VLLTESVRLGGTSGRPPVDEGADRRAGGALELHRLVDVAAQKADLADWAVTMRTRYVPNQGDDR